MTSQAPWTLAEYQKLFRNYLTEEDYEVTDIEGSIPDDLEGTFYRNGPGDASLLVTIHALCSNTQSTDYDLSHLTHIGDANSLAA